MLEPKTILTAPVDWGLGHASRCIPIIRNLLQHDYKVIMASSGDALVLLKKEFPKLETLELPEYNIEYPKNGNFFKYAMVRQLGAIRKTMKKENEIISNFIKSKKIHGIISDGRLGVRHRDIPSVFITHQLQVRTGNTTFISTKLHQHIIKKFDACWVPDYAQKTINLSGKLGHIAQKPFPVFYIGPLSRMKKQELPVTIDILALVSGPEPQRSLLEKKLLSELKKSDKNSILIQGKMEEKQVWKQEKNLRIVNYVLSDELEKLVNSSELIISRSGYSTLMDLAHLGKKAFFIPTPGQYEQRYLAGRMEWYGMAPSSPQRKFQLRKLDRVAVYDGMRLLPGEPARLTDLFEIFES